jgi:hypothetical protein
MHGQTIEGRMHRQPHKFKVGQSVSFTSGRFGRGAVNEIYKITQLLPPEGDDNQYRIKSASEPHERVVNESQLDRIAIASHEPRRRDHDV